MTGHEVTQSESPGTGGLHLGLAHLIGSWKEGVTVHLTGALERSVSQCQKTFPNHAMRRDFPQVLRTP